MYPLFFLDVFFRCVNQHRPWQSSGLEDEFQLTNCDLKRVYVNLPEDTLWLFNMAMENGPFISDFPIKTSIYSGFSMAMLNNQMVTHVVQSQFPEKNDIHPYLNIIYRCHLLMGYQHYL